MTYFVYNIKRMFVYMSLTVFFFSPTVLVIQKANRQNASDFNLEEQPWQARIHIASSNFEEDGSF